MKWRGIVGGINDGEIKFTREKRQSQDSRDLNTSMSVAGRASTQKVSRDAADLSRAMKPQNRIDIHGPRQPHRMPFLSHIHRTFTETAFWAIKHP